MKNLETSSSTLTAPSNGAQAPEQVQAWRAIDAVDMPGSRDVIKERGKFFWIEFAPRITGLSGFCTSQQAAMIIAAPDLLAALQAMIAYDSATDSLERFADIIKQADAAIVKAKGAA